MMAQFGSLSGVGVVAIPVGVLFIVLTMVYSPVTGQSASTTLETSTTSESPNSTTSVSATTDPTCANYCIKCTVMGEKGCKMCFGSNDPACSSCDQEWQEDQKCRCESGNCTTLDNDGPPLPIIIASIAGGVVLVLAVVIIICCCRRRGPPKPVKRDFRLSTVTGDLEYSQTGEFPSDDEAGIGNVIETQATNDDIYGNVDNQGNVIRFNMPNEMERSPMSDIPKPKEQYFGDIYENNMTSLQTDTSPSQGQDFGGVYENTQIGTEPVMTSRSQPRPTPSIPVRPSPSRKEEEDFGGLYTNEPMHLATNARFNLTNELTQRHAADSHQAPAVPSRPAHTPASQPSRYTDSPQKRPTNLPISQRDNFAFEGDSPHDDVVTPLPSRPAPTLNFTSQSLRLNPVAPDPGSRFNSLPIQSRETAPSLFGEPDDIADQPLRSPPAPPSKKPKNQPLQPLQPPTPTRALKLPSPPKALKPVSKKKGKVPPKTSPKRPNIERYIDDDVKGNVEMGARIVPSLPGHGDVYEVVESPNRKDFGENYEVCDIQPKPSPNEDFGTSYEYVDHPVQDTGKSDYGGSYEIVEGPSTQDYGEDYEAIERSRLDISHRAPMPTPESASSYPPKPLTPAKKKPALQKPGTSPASSGVGRSLPSHQNISGQDSDNVDFGEDYTNVPAPGGKRGHQPTHHRQPPLPVKSKFSQRNDDFYDVALQAGDDDKDEEDDSVNRNDAPGVAFTPGKHYRNVPAKREAPQRQGNYIQIQSKGH